jgi:hypothetical protein
MPNSRIAAVGDSLFFALLGVAFLLDLTGGLRIGRGWYRLSLHDPAHVLGAAVVVVLVRHLIVRHPSMRDRLAARRRARAPSPDLSLRPLSPRDAAIAGVVMTAATLILLHTQVGMLTGVPDRGDPLLSMWMLAWVAHQLPAHPLHLFDANIFYPAIGTLAYSDATLLPGLICAPFLWAGVPVAVMHGVLFCASFVLAGVMMALLARAVTGRTVPALVAGILFAFSPYRLSTYSHLQMQGVFLMPLALLFLLRTLEHGRRRDGWWLGASVAGQALWSVYLATYLCVGLAVVFAGRWLAGHFQLRARWRALGPAVVVALAILGPYSVPYWMARHAVGERPRDEVRNFSAEASDFLGVNEMDVLYGPIFHRNTIVERQLFPGVAPLVLAAVALVPPVAPLAAVSGAAALVAVDASLGMNGTTFRALYDIAAPVRALRVPARFAAVVGLFLALMSAIGLARLSDRWPTNWLARAATVALIALALVEGLPALELSPPPLTAPGIYRALAADPGAPIVDLPLPQTDAEYWIDPTYMYYSTFHWHPLLNGYSGFVPTWYARLVVASRELPSDDALRVFRQAGARYLVLHREFYHANRYHEITATLDERRDLRLVARENAPEGESSLYQFVGEIPKVF